MRDGKLNRNKNKILFCFLFLVCSFMLISCDVNENIDDTASAAKNEQTIE